jgi:hypothetical protein
LCATEYHTGRVARLWTDGEPAPPRPPFPIDRDALIVAYGATAEVCSFLSLDWDRPANLLDLHVEMKWTPAAATAR